MVEIKALGVDHPDYQSVLGNADMVIAGYNSGTETCIPDAYHEDVLLALVTWKKIAEERQERLNSIAEAELYDSYMSSERRSQYRPDNFANIFNRKQGDENR